MQTLKKNNGIKYLVFLILYFLVLTHGGAQNLTVSGGLPIYMNADSAEPVKLAARDLQRDLQNVFGRSSSIVNSLPENEMVIVISQGDDFKGSRKSVKGWEAHQVYVDGKRIVLNGADMRGTIYAIYTFSQEILGVKPLWLWASEPPVQREKIDISTDYFEKFDSPSIKYRAWFPNDRDLIIPWQRLSEDNYEAFIETMLRLKLNTLEGSIADRNSFKPPFPAGKEAGLAHQRGLINTGHHFMVFGSTYNNWDAYWNNVRDMDAPEISLQDRKSLEDYWGYHVDLAQKNNMEVIWLVGFRGNRDIPFWEFFPNSPDNDTERAKVIEEMVDTQIDILKKKTNHKKPLMRLTLYNEMSRLVANGDFHIPEEDSLIHNFVAARRDHFPDKDLLTYKFKDELAGYYMNLQFTSSGSHLAQAEGPWKMEQNFRIVDGVSNGNLIFSVMNAGNIREHVLGLSANAAMMWDFEEFNADNFVENFCLTYYGYVHAKEIATLYKDFFNSYWQQRKEDLKEFKRQYIFQDMRYARATEMILDDLDKGVYRPNVLEGHKLDNPDKGSLGYFRVEAKDINAVNQVDAIINGTKKSIEQLENITGRADNIDAELTQGKTFFNDNLRGHAYFMLHINKMLHALTKAYKEQEDIIQRKKFLEESLLEIRRAWKELIKADHPPFINWYKNDRVFGVKKIEQRLETNYENIK